MVVFQIGVIMANWKFKKLLIDDVIVGGADKFAIDCKVHNFVRESVQNVRDQAVTKSQSVKVEFSFRELGGEDLAGFKSDIRWDEGLSEHLIACAAGVNHERKIGPNLDRLASGTMRVLVVKDSGTKGLSGLEYGREGNFCKLCRNEMIPSESAQDLGRGGSFGIG